MLKTPVALIVFRRPDLTQKVMERIAVAKPRQLFIIGDGPRPDRTDDVEACAQARKVAQRVDWECDVTTNFSEVNLGCGKRPSTGISWLFKQVEEAIILEDDCLPEPTFFEFCEQMLERYREHRSVMHIAGTNFRTRPLATPFSYIFSHFNNSWGWATWARAWKHFDMAIPLWRKLRGTSWLKSRIGIDAAVNYWREVFERAWREGGRVDYWDYQWTFACWAFEGLSVVPRSNLVSNIGCGPNGTHTLDAHDPFAEVPSAPLQFPLIHPPTVTVDSAQDELFLRETILPRIQLNPTSTRSAFLRWVSGITPEALKVAYRRIRKRTVLEM